jgi:hypothetical protein
LSYFFTDHFRAQLSSDQTIMDAQQVRLVLFRQAPGLGTINPAWTAADTVAELIASGPGWAEVSGISGYPLTLQMAVGTRVLGGSKYVMFSSYPFDGLEQVAEVRAIGVVRVAALGGVSNPLIFVTNTPIGALTNLATADALTASPDTTFPDSTNRWLFGWSTAPPPATPDPQEGPLVLSRGSPSFEVSGSQHAWLYPQRVNMIANPSFEAPGTNFWSGNGALSRVSGGAPGGGAWAGSCVGAGGYCIMESNTFSTLMGESYAEQWTIQLMATGSGKLKVGLVYWDSDYRSTGVDWGDDELWDLTTGVWTHVATHRHGPDAAVAMVRLELHGTGLTIDRVLAERGYLKDWLYFDGDETYGMRDDFSWYGGANRRGASYSLWYNHRKAVTGRLFARTVDPNDPSQNVTDEDMEEQGLVYRWVPAGITVVPHLDIFYPWDPQNTVPAKPAGVLPYLTVGMPDGVDSPWVTIIVSLWGNWNATAVGLRATNGSITTSWGAWTATAVAAPPYKPATIPSSWGTWTATAVAQAIQRNATITSAWGTWTATAIGAIS